MTPKPTENETELRLRGILVLFIAAALREHEKLQKEMDMGALFDKYEARLLTLLTSDKQRLLKGLKPGWTIELPDLPYFQIIASDNKHSEWRSRIFDTKNLPLSVIQNKLEGLS